MTNNYLYYDQGWNDFIDGKPEPKVRVSVDYKDGYNDCKEETQRQGKKQDKI